ncbi:MAG: hypothetical protein Q8N51_04670, partial [Gammaproteobacteria bacterium]|nr:hypothetical protein [Gammaproteobacteria bacterium]
SLTSTAWAQSGASPRTIASQREHRNVLSAEAIDPTIGFAGDLRSLQSTQGDRFDRWFAAP